MNPRPYTPAMTPTLAIVTSTKSFNEIQAGDCAVLEQRITAEAIDAFASLSGDRNPLHMDEEFAQRTSFGRPVAHGMLLGAYLSTLIGMQLPGPGALWTEQNFRWLKPVFAGDSVRVVLSVVHKSRSTRTLKVHAEAFNQENVKVMEGSGLVMMVDSNA